MSRALVDSEGGKNTVEVSSTANVTLESETAVRPQTNIEFLANLSIVVSHRRAGKAL